MGYSASAQLFVGANLFDIVKEIKLEKVIDVKDEWSGEVKGQKRLSKKSYKLGDQEFDDIYEIEEVMGSKGLELFRFDCESRGGIYVGIGNSTDSYKTTVIKTNLDRLEVDTELVKKALAEFGYDGDVLVYCMKYESY